MNNPSNTPGCGGPICWRDKSDPEAYYRNTIETQTNNCRMR